MTTDVAVKDSIKRQLRATDEHAAVREEARRAIWSAFARAVRAREAGACYTVLQLHEACQDLLASLP